MVYAPRGVGKTLFVWSVAYAVATGGMTLRGKALKPRKVLIVDGEMPAVVLQERLAEIVKTADANPPGPGMIRVVSADQEPDGIPDLSTPEGRRPLMRSSATPN